MRGHTSASKVRRKAAVHAIVITVAVIGVACGGRGGGGGPRLSKADYEQKVKVIGDGLVSIFEAISNPLADIGNPDYRDPSLVEDGADIIKEAVELIRQGADGIRSGADDLDELNPPAEVEAAHSNLVQGFREFADDLDEVAQNAENGDVDQLNAFEKQISDGTLPSAAKLEAAGDAFKAAGYDIGSTASP